MAKIHRLKVWSSFFYDLKCGDKNFEVRKNDRDFQPGDYLVLDKWFPLEKEYDNEEEPVVRLVSYVMSGGDFGISEGVVVMGIFELEQEDTAHAILDVAPERGAPVPLASESQVKT